MVTVLHVVLFKTADSEHTTRERAMQLLQLLDRRFLAESGHSRPELLGCLTGGAYSQSHVTFSKELATSNPELTFPLFCGRSTIYMYMYMCVCVHVCNALLSHKKWCIDLRWHLGLASGTSCSTWCRGYAMWNW